MTVNEIKQSRERVCALLDESRVSEAFDALEPMLTEAGVWELREQVEQLQMSYRFMLQYLSQGIVDPQRHEVLTHITNGLYTIADQCSIALLEPLSHEVFYARRRELGTTPLDEIVGRLRVEQGKLNLLGSVSEGERDKQAIASIVQQAELHETSIFNKIWSTFPTPDSDVQCITALLADAALPDHTKCLVVSALLLGLLRVYDERKLLMLADAYTTSPSALVQLRALVGLLLALKLHNRRASQSAALASHLKAVADEEQLQRDLAMAQFLLARTRNTENITRRVQEDLMPGIMKLRPDMLRKLREQDADAIDLEANPEWQKMLEDSGMARKMEELNALQLDGSDVFISTFSRLKSFPFFQTLSNWFLPFHGQHSSVLQAFGADEAPLRTLVERAPFLCDSDRYSFSLSLATVPPSQRQLMISQINQHAAELSDIEREELPDPQRERERLTNMYVQDLYRFFHLFSRRREFPAAFDSDMDFTEVPYLGDRISSPDSLQLVAEFYFNNHFYHDAIKHYNHLLAATRDADPHIFQKLGFCNQSIGQPAEALKQYRRYELADDSDLWTIKHIAACHRTLKHYDEALDCYRRALSLQPGNVATILNIGHCLLEQGRYNEALQHYFQADLAEEGGQRHRAWRPIAWCSFLMGNDERSLDYCDRVIAHGDATAQDHLNRGHVLLAMQRVAEALDSYRQALRLMKDDAQALRQAIDADRHALAARGINTQDLPLLVDTITQKN